MSAGCNFEVASMVAPEGKVGRWDVCQHEGDTEKRVKSEWHVGRTVEKYRRSMSKSVALLAEIERAYDVM